MSDRRGSFSDRVLDGHARIDQLEIAIEQWANDPRGKQLHEVLGLDADELDLVAGTPDALRYILHARRFGRTIDAASLRGQRGVKRVATMLAADVIDPHQLASLEHWKPEPAHA